MLIEKLPPHRWREYREFRLLALQTDPRAFGASYDVVSERPDNWWIGHLGVAQVDPNKTILFAFDGEKLIGMGGAYPEQDPANVDVTAMFVTPQQRGKGVGQAILSAILAEVEATEVRLCVNDDQPAAVRLYRRNGFVTLAETPMTHPGGTPYVQLYMALRESGSR